MNDQLFQMIMADLQDIKKKIDGVQSDIRSLHSFRGRVYGVASIVGFLASAITGFLTKIFG